MSDFGPPPGAESALALLRIEYGQSWEIAGQWRDGEKIGAWLCTAKRRQPVPGHGEADEPNCLIHWDPSILRVMIQRSEDAFPVAAG